MPAGQILKDNTTVEVRSGAFGGISGTVYKAIGGIIDIDFGSVHKDVISGQKRVTTGITFGGEFFGFEFGIKLWTRDIPFEDFPPGCLYCEPADWWDPYGSPPWETGVSDGARRRGLGGSIGFGIGVDVGHDPLGNLNDVLIWGERGLGPRGGEFSISGGVSVGAEGFNLGLIWVTGTPSEDFPIQLNMGGDVAGGLVNGSLQEIEGRGSAINLIVPTPIPSPYGATVSGLNDAEGRDYGIQVGVGAGVPVGWSITDTTTTTLTTRGAAEVIVDWICTWKGC